MSDVRRRAVLYGAGNNCIYSISELLKAFDIVGVCDGDSAKQGQTMFGYAIRNIVEIPKENYDVIVVTPSYTNQIIEVLVRIGIDKDRIIMLEDALEDEVYGLDLRIAVIFYGGLGDYIIGKNWLYHLEEKLGISVAKIDAYFSANMMEGAHAIFDGCNLIKCIEEVDTQRPELVDQNEYDVVIAFSIIPVIRYMDDRKVYKSDYGVYQYLEKIRRFGFEYFHRGFFANPNYYRDVSKLFSMFPKKKYHELYDVTDEMKAPGDYLFAMRINIDEAEYLKQLELEKFGYITINTGVNAEYTRKPSTRVWPIQKWCRLIELLRDTFPAELKIVRMGLDISGKIKTAADVELSGKTSVEQAKVLLKNALVHVDYEGGLVHLRHVLCRKPSVVLHGPTSVDRYGYPENVAVRTGDCPKACEWSARDWLTICHNDRAPYICMDSVTPEYVTDVTLSVVGKERQ